MLLKTKTPPIVSWVGLSHFSTLHEIRIKSLNPCVVTSTFFAYIIIVICLCITASTKHMSRFNICQVSVC
jgi:hypothetical protein